MDRIVRGVTAAVGVFNLGAGVWAFFAPASFFDVVATFPPYNEHFLHDVGAFQIGAGVALLAALWMRDAFLVVLAGAGAGSGIHLVSHVIDGDLGGRATDVPGLAILLAAVLYALVRRARTTETEKAEVMR